MLRVLSTSTGYCLIQCHVSVVHDGLCQRGYCHHRPAIAACDIFGICQEARGKVSTYRPSVYVTSRPRASVRPRAPVGRRSVGSRSITRGFVPSSVRRGDRRMNHSYSSLGVGTCAKCTTKGRMEIGVNEITCMQYTASIRFSARIPKRIYDNMHAQATAAVDETMQLASDTCVKTIVRHF